MDVKVIGVMIPILISLGLFALIFGIVYLRNREKMAMIERGMNPGIDMGKPVNRNYVLTWACLLIGAGLGLFIAYILDSTLPWVNENDDNPAIYFSLIAVFGGLGLFTSYLIEKKDSKEVKE
jgi:ABC-type Na+ efflux pump permease subunit